jgi:hypothetical protein
MPFSVANWVAQSNGVAQNTIPTTGAVKLGSPNGVATYTGSGSALVPSATFYNTAPYGRDTYLVVEYARVTVGQANYDATLAGLVDSSVATSLTNFGTGPSQPGAVKKKYGFLAPLGTTPLRAYTW